MPARSPAYSLRRLFFAFSALIICAYVISLFQNWHSALKDTQNSLTHINSAQVQGVYATLKSYELVLASLGGELFSIGALSHPENGRELIERMKSIAPDMVGFGLARPDGQLVLVSGIKGNTPLPNLLSMPESHDSFMHTITTGHIQMGRPYFMKPLGQWAIPIRTPIYSKTGELVAVMTAGYSISASSTGWSNIEFPQHVVSALLRDDGYLQFIYPEIKLTRQEIYGQPVASQTISQAAALPATKGFTSMYFPRLNTHAYLAYQRLDEYSLLSGSFIPRVYVVGLWLEKMIAPSVLL